MFLFTILWSVRSSRPRGERIKYVSNKKVRVERYPLWQHFFPGSDSIGLGGGAPNVHMEIWCWYPALVGTYSHCACFVHLFGDGDHFRLSPFVVAYFLQGQVASQIILSDRWSYSYAGFGSRLECRSSPSPQACGSRRWPLQYYQRLLARPYRLDLIQKETRSTQG